MSPPARSSRLPPCSGYQAWYRLRAPPLTSGSIDAPDWPSTVLPRPVSTLRAWLNGSAAPGWASEADGVPAVYTPYTERVAMSPADTRRRSPVPVRTTLNSSSRTGTLTSALSGGVAGTSSSNTGPRPQSLSSVGEPEK